jgi:hypothetical protein
MDAFSQFGIDTFKIFIQLFLAFIFIGIPTIYATVEIVRSYHSATAILLWLVLIWFIPIIGPLSAILSVRAQQEHSRPN